MALDLQADSEGACKNCLSRNRLILLKCMNLMFGLAEQRSFQGCCGRHTTINETSFVC